MPSRPSPLALRVVRPALAAAAVAGLLAAPGPAAATFNKFLSAQALAPRRWEVGLVGGFGDVEPNYLTGYAFARRGLLRNVDIGARVGAISVDRPDDDLGVLLAADARVQVLRESIEIPFDFAVDAGLTVALPGGSTYSDLGFAALFSRTFRPHRSVGTLVPYLGIELVFLAGRARPGDDDSAAFGIAGADLRLTPRFAVTPEVKVGRDTVYGIAVRYRF